MVPVRIETQSGPPLIVPFYDMSDLDNWLIKHDGLCTGFGIKPEHLTDERLSYSAKHKGLRVLLEGMRAQ